MSNQQPKLRDYQSNALAAARAAYAKGKKRVMCYAPTGAGKTMLAAEAMRMAASKGRRAAFVVNRTQLVSQTSSALTALNIPHGIIQAENTRDSRSDIVVCSIQTLARRGFPDGVGFIVIDEAHWTAGSRQYRRFMALHNNVPMLGLSATPFARGLGKEHRDLCGQLWEELVIAATIRDLIAQGYLVDVDIYAPSEPELSQVRIVAGEYHEGELGKAVDQPKLIGDIVEHWSRHARGRPTVCFATNIVHSHHIVAQFRAAGVAAEHIDCYMADEEREAVVQRFRSGEIAVLSNVALLAEGFDVPACEVMILARPTKSLIRYIQMAGRVLRPYPGKTRALILDHSGSCKELGYPTDDLPLELDDGKPRERKESKPQELLPTRCPKCSYMKPPKVHVCPACGFAPEKRDATKVGEGNLVLLERRPKGKLAKTGLTDQDIYSQLLGVAIERGYKPGWAAHQFKKLFGTMPTGLSEAPAVPSGEIRSWVVGQLIRQARGMAKGGCRVAA